MDKNKSFGYADKASTSIWHEEPSSDNPYIAEDCRLYGYRMLDLCQNKCFSDVLYLMFTGELPTAEQSNLLEKLLIAFISPGIRHPATRAAMAAGIGKSDTAHILPIGLIAMGGQHVGSTQVERTMLFIKEHMDTKPDQFMQHIPMAQPDGNADWNPYPGIGSNYGSQDIYTNKLAQYIGTLPAVADAFRWLQALLTTIDNNRIGWLPVGLFSTILIDLGIQPREGGTLFQLISAPGILAQGVEQTHKPISSMPFLDDENYVFKPEQ